MFGTILCKSNAPIRRRITGNVLSIVKNSKRYGGGGGSGMWEQFNGYREPNYMPWFKFEKRLATLLGCFGYTWMFYHCYYYPGHLFGEWEEPDLSKWSDEELGIPPDEDGLAPVIPNVRSIHIPGGPTLTRNKEPYILKEFFGDTGVYKF
ncbi:NADH dehydrogenase [ubiquinone] 1 beta subcomplex subunit 2-like protein [Leptotrombidium deliense]|uniref:NADH dehydrogenase [ubiquinone] 1 beta subcomplex subunit 2-like protein n=1 Tax=Leptotrombidium deliense TaxID=299467 RepID=A0A443SPY6_9ACAR|nr:NADH dehydrogenase [ubiquinone] 1 beta subcomplex subunit 2-like protein [Leptotrombidium deliense]